MGRSIPPGVAFILFGHVLNHVQRYCNANPEHRLFDAVTDWFGSLPK
jgi:hypothetical protein